MENMCNDVYDSKVEDFSGSLVSKKTTLTLISAFFVPSGGLLKAV